MYIYIYIRISIYLSISLSLSIYIYICRDEDLGRGVEAVVDGGRLRGDAEPQEETDVQAAEADACEQVSCRGKRLVVILSIIIMIIAVTIVVMIIKIITVIVIIMLTPLV